MRAIEETDVKTAGSAQAREAGKDADETEQKVPLFASDGGEKGVNGTIFSSII
jgi:hypothetical protein